MKKRLFSKIVTITAAAVVMATNIPVTTITVQAADDYAYLYAGLTWQEYWANEGVYQAGDASSSDILDSHQEYDTGAFDAVTRATTNHGLHRGSFQCITTIDTEDGKTYDLAGWEVEGEGKEAVAKMKLIDGTVLSYEKGVITNTDGSTSKLSKYEVKGLKYVPVKIKKADLNDFKSKYTTVENGNEIYGGYSENELSSYSLKANVTENTNGLKTAAKNNDGTFTFSKRQAGTDSGIEGQAIKTASDITAEVKEAAGSYGEFLRVDLTGADYGALGSMLQTVTWTYYGNDSARTKALGTFGTKFAADNWMHKSMGIQLGLTNSMRCQLPDDTDGTGYWTLTVHALGYQDYTVNFEATADNIVMNKEPVSDTSKLEAIIKKADSLKEEDYTQDSWAAMKLEYDEGVDALNIAEYQSDVNEATQHLTMAINALVENDSEPEKETNYVSTGIILAILILITAGIIALRFKSRKKM